MTKENIVLYAKLLQDVFGTNNPFVIADKLCYKIWPLRCDAKGVVLGKTYKTENERVIVINTACDEVSQRILCAHELGHAVFRHKDTKRYKLGTPSPEEYEANLFAVALLFNDEDFNIPISDMSNYTLQSILDKNIRPPW